jgi:hypothetical protein
VASQPSAVASQPSPGQAWHQASTGASPQYSQWARSQPSPGTTYGPGSARYATLFEATENTDSLTGRILAQGRPDTDGTGNTLRVVVIMLIMLAAVVVVTVIAIS